MPLPASRRPSAVDEAGVTWALGSRPHAPPGRTGTGSRRRPSLRGDRPCRPRARLADRRPRLDGVAVRDGLGRRLAGRRPLAAHRASLTGGLTVSSLHRGDRDGLAGAVGAGGSPAPSWRWHSDSSGLPCSAGGWCVRASGMCGRAPDPLSARPLSAGPQSTVSRPSRMTFVAVSPGAAQRWVAPHGPHGGPLRDVYLIVHGEAVPGVERDVLLLRRLEVDPLAGAVATLEHRRQQRRADALALPLEGRSRASAGTNGARSCGGGRRTGGRVRTAAGAGG